MPCCAAWQNCAVQPLLHHRPHWSPRPASSIRGTTTWSAGASHRGLNNATAAGTCCAALRTRDCCVASADWCATGRVRLLEACRHVVRPCHGPDRLCSHCQHSGETWGASTPAPTCHPFWPGVCARPRLCVKGRGLTRMKSMPARACPNGCRSWLCDWHKIPTATCQVMTWLAGWES